MSGANVIRRAGSQAWRFRAVLFRIGIIFLLFALRGAHGAAMSPTNLPSVRLDGFTVCTWAQGAYSVSNRNVNARPYAGTTNIWVWNNIEGANAIKYGGKNGVWGWYVTNAPSAASWVVGPATGSPDSRFDILANKTYTLQWDSGMGQTVLRSGLSGPYAVWKGSYWHFEGIPGSVGLQCTAPGQVNSNLYTGSYWWRDDNYGGSGWGITLPGVWDGGGENYIMLCDTNRYGETNTLPGVVVLPNTTYPKYPIVGKESGKAVSGVGYWCIADPYLFSPPAGPNGSPYYVFKYGGRYDYGENWYPYPDDSRLMQGTGNVWFVDKGPATNDPAGGFGTNDLPLYYPPVSTGERLVISNGVPYLRLPDGSLIGWTDGPLQIEMKDLLKDISDKIGRVGSGSGSNSGSYVSVSNVFNLTLTNLVSLSNSVSVLVSNVVNLTNSVNVSNSFAVVVTNTGGYSSNLFDGAVGELANVGSNVPDWDIILSAADKFQASNTITDGNATLAGLKSKGAAVSNAAESVISDGRVMFGISGTVLSIPGGFGTARSWSSPMSLPSARVLGHLSGYTFHISMSLPDSGWPDGMRNFLLVGLALLVVVSVGWLVKSAFAG